MSTHQTHAHAPDIRAGRLEPEHYARNFSEAVAPLSAGQAVLEAERCLYCFDAPCATACPTSIDVPSFIKRIGDGNLRGAACAGLLLGVTESLVVSFLDTQWSEAAGFVLLFAFILFRPNGLFGRSASAK